jgi:5-methyltetrahydropteroyltriglutamate--homocysteine methyltransferase
MKAEYEGIAKAGFLIQIDSPDLALGRHVLFKDKVTKSSFL